MSYETQHNALRSRFEAEWGTETQVEWPNGPALDPPDTEAWVRFVVQDLDASQVSMGDPGNNVHRHEGAVVIMIFAPAGAGDQRALELADRAAAVFRGWQAPLTGLRFLRPPFVRRVGREQKWYHINVFCPFTRDEHF